MNGKKNRSEKTKPKSDKQDNDDYSLNHYFREIGKIRLLSRDEEEALSGRIQEGNLQALQELVRRNLKYVVTVAKKYRGCGLSFQDLIEEGNIGLIQAAKRFDGTRKIKFITYANWWIRQAIIHALAEQSGTVRIPIKQAGILYKIGRQYEDLYQALEREPTRAEMAQTMGLEEDQIETILRAYRTHLSLDSPLSNRDETPYLELLEAPDYIPFDDQLLQASLKQKIGDLIKDLSKREEQILRMRFGFDGDPMTLEKIGQTIGLSRERVRQIEERAKKKLAKNQEKITGGEN